MTLYTWIKHEGKVLSKRELTIFTEAQLLQPMLTYMSGTFGFMLRVQVIEKYMAVIASIASRVLSAYMSIDEKKKNYLVVARCVNRILIVVQDQYDIPIEYVESILKQLPEFYSVSGLTTERIKKGELPTYNE